MPIKSDLVEPDHSAALIAPNPEIAAQLLRDLPSIHWQALRDFYFLNAEEATICAQYALSPDGFRDLRRQLRLRYAETQNPGGRKPAGSASSAGPARLRQSA